MRWCSSSEHRWLRKLLICSSKFFVFLGSCNSSLWHFTCHELMHFLWMITMFKLEFILSIIFILNSFMIPRYPILLIILYHFWNCWLIFQFFRIMSPLIEIFWDMVTIKFIHYFNLLLVFKGPICMVVIIIKIFIISSSYMSYFSIFRTLD